MARVVKQLMLQLNDKPILGVYIGSDNGAAANSDDDQAKSTPASGQGHLILLVEGILDTDDLKHKDASDFPMSDNMEVSKIDVKDSYRISHVKYDDVEKDFD